MRDYFPYVNSAQKRLTSPIRLFPSVQVDIFYSLNHLIFPLQTEKPGDKHDAVARTTALKLG